MDIQRLKFAHARGARIQVPQGATQWKGDRHKGEWVTVGHPYWSPSQTFRIHPEDTHLEYGPLSSDLRRRAIEQDFSEVDVNWIVSLVKLSLWHGIWIYLDYSDKPFGLVAATEGRMYMLFLAELLADEGL